MIRYNYLGYGNFKYRWEILSTDDMINRLCYHIDLDLDMWNDEYRKVYENYLPYGDEYVKARIRTIVKILILILITRIPGVSSGNIKIDGNNIINLQAEFWDSFRIYVQINDTTEETVYIDYRDDNNETLYKGNISLIDLDTFLNDTIK